MNEAIVTMVRGIIAFVTLLILTRFLGKQQLSQLTFFDYVLGITVGSIAASMTTDLDNRAWPQWVGLLTWVVLVLALQWITMKWRYSSKYLDGEPTIVIMNGNIMEEAMRKMRFRLTDLLERLREKGVFDPSEVEFAVLETDGKLSVLKKTQYQPVSPKDMNIPTEYKGMNTELIYDGRIFDQNLREVNLDRPWLEGELNKMGISHASEVFLAALDTSGNLYVDRYKDSVKNPVDIGDYPGPN